MAITVRPSRFLCATVTASAAVCALLLAGCGAIKVTHSDAYRGSTELLALDPDAGRQLWRTALPAAAIGTPTVVAGMAYVEGASDSDGGTFFAVDLRTGRRVWQALVEGAGCGGVAAYVPQVVGGVAVVGGPRGAIRGLDAGSGQELWRVSGTTVPVTGAADYVIVGTSHGRAVRALDRRTGHTRWTAAFRSGELSGGPGPGDTSPPVATAANDVVLVDIGPSPPGILPPGVVGIVALDAATGRERWRTPLGYRGGGDLGNSHLADPSTVVALRGPPTEPGFVMDPNSEPLSVQDVHYSVDAFDAATGLRRWRQPVDTKPNSDGYAAITRAWASDGAAYFFPDGKTLVAVDARTGAVRWKARGQRKDNDGYLDPADVAAGHDVVILSGRSGITARRADNGLQLWKKSLSGISELGSPTVADSAVLVPRSHDEHCGQGSG